MGHSEHGTDSDDGHDCGYCHCLATILPKIHLSARYEEAFILIGFRSFYCANNRGCRLLGW
jgi:hypothetical protein